MLNNIKAMARRQLAEVGAAGLSVRLIARELGLSSSAIYRYFASRDELLTVLILEGYAAQGDEVEAAEARVPRDDHVGRILAVAQAARGFALAHPHDYALLYGSPVPGYRAPAATTIQAARPTLVLAQVLVDANAGQRLVAPGPSWGLDEGLEPHLREALPGMDQLGPGVLGQGVFAWSAIYGLISFEVFGHLVGSVADNDVYFASAVRQLASTLVLD